MSAASNFLENKVLDHTLRYSTAPYTGASTVYIGLFTANTGDALESGTLTYEVAGNGYTRKSVTFAAASSGTSATNATVTFDAATGNWGTISFVAILDAATAGNVLFWGAVTTPKTIETGDTFQVSSGNLTVSLA
jgi:hypothetical protein